MAEDDIDQPWSDFEIDADASSYTGYVPKQVAFVARAMNGTPPFTFKWDFGDGSPQETGESVMHIFTRLGKNDVFVTGTDGQGRTSRVQMILFLLTPEEYARRQNLDPAALPTIVASPAPIP
jgi:PKD repeat protein